MTRTDTTTDRIVIACLRLGACTLPKLRESTGNTEAALKASLETLVGEGRVIACAHTQTFWNRQPGTVVVRSVAEHCNVP